MVTSARSDHLSYLFISRVSVRTQDLDLFSRCPPIPQFVVEPSDCDKHVADRHRLDLREAEAVDEVDRGAAVATAALRCVCPRGNRAAVSDVRSWGISGHP